MEEQEKYKELEDLETRKLEEEEDCTDAIMPPSDIVAFTEQRSCADLYRMYEKKQLDINPEFQRGEVWTNRAQTVFIDSLMKQLPIPSMCISVDIKSQKRLVIDGLQRITTIVKFLDTENDWKLSKCNDVDQRLSGRKVSVIKQQNEEVYDSIENVTVPVTVIRCDYSNQHHMQYLFQIFYRLNTGGNKLYNQEIRNCIFSGSLNNLLKELSHSELWLNYVRLTTTQIEKARMAHEERILRFFAFYDCYKSYDGKLALFLNEYMKDHKDLSQKEIQRYKSLFFDMITIVNNCNIKISSKNVAESVFIGIAMNIDHLKGENSTHINNLYNKLYENKLFSAEELKEGLGGKEKMIDRIDLAISNFAL